MDSFPSDRVRQVPILPGILMSTKYYYELSKLSLCSPVHPSSSNSSQRQTEYDMLSFSSREMDYGRTSRVQDIW
jgi:hypothetical protein